MVGVGVVSAEVDCSAARGEMARFLGRGSSAAGRDWREGFEARDGEMEARLKRSAQEPEGEFVGFVPLQYASMWRSFRRQLRFS